MEDKLFDILDDLNIRDTKLLLDDDINLLLDSSTRRRIEKSIKKKTGYYNKSNIMENKINNILGNILMKKKIALALSVGVILSLAGGGYAYAKTPVAYVSMDINPSVELGVNAFDKVVSVEAYNEDGEKILEGTDLVNADVEKAVSTVISNAISEGYIKEDGLSAIEITTSTDKDDVATKLDESLKEIAEETLNDNNVEAEVETQKVALVRRDEARKLGITPGKLNLIQKLQELDPTINVEDYKTSSIKDIQKKTKELRKNINSDEANIENSSSPDMNADVVTKDATSSKTSVNSDGVTIVEIEKDNSNDSNNKDNNNNIKKEENSNVNRKKEENNTVTNETKTTDVTTEKQNNSNNVKSQENNNHSKSEKSRDLESNSNNSNSSKSGSSGNGNSSSQNKGKSKNN